RAPWVAPARAASFVVAVVGLSSGAAAELVGLVAWPFLQGVIALAQLFAAAPFASLRVGAIEPWAVGAWYGAMGVGYLIARGDVRRVTPWALPGMTVAAVVLWMVVLTPTPDALTLWFPDTRGESTFVQSANGQLVVIDTGSNDRAVADRLSALAPFWRRRLDVVIITDWTPDRIGAARELTRRFAIGALIVPPSTNELSQRIVAAYVDRRIPVVTVDRPYTVQLADGATITVTPIGGAINVLVTRAAFRAALGAARPVDQVTLARLPFGHTQLSLYGRPVVAVVTLPPETPSPAGATVYRTDEVGEVRATARDQQLEIRAAKALSRP
ncbi:MAG: MBL fold metallo-hydrolase, partial [Dehalococcoidia bacterium]|nr:MBL fold metallo-hydrolase [Dehalococcoidia bacterium]